MRKYSFYQKKIKHFKCFRQLQLLLFLFGHGLREQAEKLASMLTVRIVRTVKYNNFIHIQTLLLKSLINIFVYSFYLFIYKTKSNIE